MDVDLVEGCPMVAYIEALALIQELEESNSRMALRCHVFADEGIHANWLDQASGGSGFSSVPEHAAEDQRQAGGHSGEGS